MDKLNQQNGIITLLPFACFIAISFESTSIISLSENRTGEKYFSLIELAAMMGCNHENNVFLLVNFVEETPGSDTVAPGWRGIGFRFFYIWAVIWVRFKLRIDIRF